MAQIKFIIFPVILLLILPGLPAEDITLVGVTMTAPRTVTSLIKITMMSHNRATFTPADVTAATEPTEPSLVTSPTSTVSTTTAATPKTNTAPALKMTTVSTEKMDKTNWEATSTHEFIPASSTAAKSTTMLMPVSYVSTTFSVTQKSTTETSLIARKGTESDTTTPLEPTTLQDASTVVSLLPTTDLTSLSSQMTTSSTENSPTVVTESTTPIGMRSLTDWLSNPSTTDTSTSSQDSILIKDPFKPGILWWIIVTMLVSVIVVAAVTCLYLFVTLRRRKRTKHFGSNRRNGHWSKRKKMAEKDAWAGPVNLGKGEAGECDGVQEGGNLEDSPKEANGTEMALSTFIAHEADGGRGRPDGGIGRTGSVEAQRWEEEAPLLYIDEDAKREAEGTPKQNNAEDMRVGETKKEAEDGKSETAFCITTAV